ncbi:sensor histidine kinase [Streptomyces maremycinicus]|uniref:sensor histidine kinase n=1 Tax=Streptomyces maremycinicus TaxID=1679753 RepID=UPI0007C72C3F|nr:histidine kinase [Streptomyces sp. NBRC 110468]
MRTIGRRGRAAVHGRLREARLVGCVGLTSLATACGDPTRFPGWPTPLDIVFACLASAVLPARHRSPLGVLAAVSALSVVHQAGGGPFVPSLPPLMVALYTVALRSGRRQAWTAAALTMAALSLTAMFFQAGPLLGPQRVGAIAWMGLATAVGDSVRNRRAYVRALEERADRAERTREEEAARRVAGERMRIARELHDVVAHELTLINAQAGIGVHVGRGDPVQMAEFLEAIRDGSKGALGELRSIVGLLGQPGDPVAPREPSPGVGRLEDLVVSFDRAGLRVAVDREGQERPAPSAVDVAAYRIVQEALTNVRKHAGVDTARVRLRYGHDVLHVMVEDDGNPLRRPGGGGGTGRGLIGMRERAAAVGGSTATGPRPGGGFVVEAWLPLGPARVPVRERVGNEGDQ